MSGADVGGIEVGVLDRPARPGRASLRNFVDADGGTIDSGIALRFPAPRSFTGEDVLELQGHGGPAVMARLLRRCVELGARHAEPGEFSLRAFENGRIDLAQAEGMADLVGATTEEAARMAAASMRGALGERARSFAGELTAVRGEIEAAIDFSDEDITPAGGEEILGRLKKLREGLSALAAECRRSVSFGRGATVALAGEPNAGKSSLLNLLSSRSAAIVDEEPGTTRDVVSATCDIGGVPVTLLDTAGLRDGGGKVEREGMRRAREAMEEADHVVQVHDVTAGPVPADIGTEPALVVLNKVDLAGDALKAGEGEVAVSAKTGKNLDGLVAALAELCGAAGEAPAFLARERHADAFAKASDEVSLALGAGLGMTEVPAEHLRAAGEALGSVTGEVSADDLLGEIFSRFCIGK